MISKVCDKCGTLFGMIDSATGKVRVLIYDGADAAIPHERNFDYCRDCIREIVQILESKN